MVEDGGVPDKPLEGSCSLRFSSFNINGLNTLFNYHPWNELKLKLDKDSNRLEGIFEFLKADIISLQELKIGNVDKVLVTSGFKSFVSLSKSKRSYSGVGLFIRIPQKNDDINFQKALIIKKVEEGLTGNLKVPSSGEITYKESPDGIGGYPLGFDVSLDNEGRCIIVELNFNIVIISLYCPANSNGTESGELFRLNFLKCLIERCKNLISMGKEVIVMGDINVSRDLIDNDEIIREGLKIGILQKNLNGKQNGDFFENINFDQVFKFRESTQAKKLINDIIKDDYFEKLCQEHGIIIPNSQLDKKFLYDTIRISQGRKLKLYTCWNTLKNNRSINSGSRIDHIFATEKLAKNSYGNILPHLMGSDHCPIYCDFQLQDYIKNFIKDDKFGKPEDQDYYKLKNFKFEVKNFYNVGTNIDRFFRKKNNQPLQLDQNTGTSQTSNSQEEQVSQGPVYKKRKPDINSQQKISDYFFKPTTLRETSSRSPIEETPNSPAQSSSSSQSQSASSSHSCNMDSFKNVVDENKVVPKCLHNEPCVLRVSTKKLTKGKRFWCCNRKSNIQPPEGSCNYFKWTS